MKKILFPTDFSPIADNAFQYAIALAEEVEASIDLLHVYSIPFNDSTALPPDYIQQLLDDAKKYTATEFDKIIDRYPNAPIRERHAVYGLFIATEIAELAKKKHYELIVMGTKGGHNIVEKIMGSNTSHTIMRAHCPILSIPAEATYQSIRKIAYATAFDPSDVPAVGQLIDFAGQLGAEVNFVHVDTKSGSGITEEIVEIENYPVPFTEFVVINDPSVVNGLDGYIVDRNINLVAMYIPHRRLWERIFHISVTKKMALHSKIPLLTFSDQ